MQRLKLTEYKHYSPVYVKIKGQILVLWCKVVKLHMMLLELTMHWVISPRGKGGGGESVLPCWHERGQEVLPLECSVWCCEDAGLLWCNDTWKILFPASPIGLREVNKLLTCRHCCSGLCASHPQSRALTLCHTMTNSHLYCPTIREVGILGHRKDGGTA